MARGIPVRPFTSGGAVLSLRSRALLPYVPSSCVFSLFREGGSRFQVLKQLPEGGVEAYPSCLVSRSVMS